MRAKTDDLYHLIKSLSISEHRYFSKFIREQNLKNSEFLEKMFLLIRDQEAYDEKAVKEQLQDYSHFRFFAQYKSQLTELIHTSLINYHKESSIEAEIHHLLQVESVLNKKNLYDQCESIIEKGKEIASKYEYHLSEMELLKRESTLIGELLPKGHEERFNKIISEKSAVLLKLKNETEYRDLCFIAFHKIRKLNECRDGETEHELSELMRHPALKNENNALNLWAKLYFNYTHARYYRMLKNFKTSLEYRKRIVDLWRLHPHRISEKPEFYRAAILNLLGNLHVLNEYDECFELLEEAKQIKVKSETDNANFFQQIKLYELLIYINTNRFENVLAILPEIEEGLSKYNSLIQNSFRLSIYFNTSLAYFILADYKNSLKWINQIIHFEKTEERQDIQDFSKIFRLILFYCDDKHDIIGDYLRAAKRILQKNNRLYDLESIILKRLPQLIDNQGNEELQILNKFMDDLVTIGYNGNTQTLGMQEVGLWLESRIKKIPMRQALAEANAKQQAKS